MMSNGEAPRVRVGADGPRADGPGFAALPVMASMVSSVTKSEDVAVGSQARRVEVWGYMEGEASALLEWAAGEAKLGQSRSRCACRCELARGFEGLDGSMLRMEDSGMICLSVFPRIQVRTIEEGGEERAYACMRERHGEALAAMVGRGAGLRWVEVSRREQPGFASPHWREEELADALRAASSSIVAERERVELEKAAALAGRAKGPASI